LKEVENGVRDSMGLVEKQEHGKKRNAIFQCVDRYFKAVDVAIQHQPHIIALVWGGVVLVFRFNSLPYILFQPGKTN
jgi:hypothetical protein